MAESLARRRVAGMSVEQRREMIVAAALPLVAEHGAGVTTSQIARAAGISEAAIFRAFTDKDEVLEACVAEAMRADHVLRELASISLEEPLDIRLTDAVEALRAHLARMGAIGRALYSSGRRRRERSDGPGRPPQGLDDREASMTAIREGVAELLEPDRASLRLTPSQVAAIFLALIFTRPRQTGEGDNGELSPESIVEVLLHGTYIEIGGEDVDTEMDTDIDEEIDEEQEDSA